MKRLISSLVLAFTFVIAASGTAMAEHYWKLDMFQPTGSITGNSFNIEYKVLSIEQNDDFTVKLFQNGSEIATQNTTKDYGDSGVFSVNVPGPGTYQYHVSAQIGSGEGETKTTEDRTLTVTSTPEGAVTTVFVNQAGAPGGGVAGGGVAGPGGNAAGEVAGAAAQPGQVNAAGEGETKSDEKGDVLGSDKKNENKDNKNGSNNNWAWWVLAAAAVSGAGYYVIQRTGKNPFSRSDS